MTITNRLNCLPQKLSPVTLETQLIKLIPLTMQHLTEFSHAGNHHEIWQYMSVSNQCINTEKTKLWIQEAIKAMAAGNEVVFVIIDKATNKLVGSTRLLRFNQEQSTLEIGHTFITPSFQRTYVNSHAKYLLLTYVFESLGINRVEICTHQNNVKSRHAIMRIGGHFEGIIRQHRLQESGQYRNTALFSILNNEWLRVKNNLLSSGTRVSEFSHEKT